MLAFTRRPNESFLIGEDIVVKVLGRDDDGNIQFGIVGIKSVSVSRDEIDKSNRREVSDINSCRE